MALAKERQQATGVKLLWGTANLFSDPRYMNGAATNPDFRVFTHAAAQVKAAIDATIALGGSGYVFWGGREGYTSLLNTDMKRELETPGALPGDGARLRAEERASPARSSSSRSRWSPRSTSTTSTPPR